MTGRDARPALGGPLTIGWRMARQSQELVWEIGRNAPVERRVAPVLCVLVHRGITIVSVVEVLLAAC